MYCLLIREDHIKKLYLFSSLLLSKLFGLIAIFSCMVWPYGVKYSAFWFLFIPPSGFDLPTLLQLIHKKLNVIIKGQSTNLKSKAKRSNV